MPDLANHVIIWGGGGHAEVVADIVRCEARWHVAGFLDDSRATQIGVSFCNSVLLGGDAQLPALRARGLNRLLVAIGDCQVRLRLAQQAQAHGFELVTTIHPRATVAASATLGPGTVVAAGAVINPGAQVGRCAIINTHASVDHHCALADGVHICPGVHLAGNVTIGATTWVGIGSIVKERLTIGANTLVGAGSLVLQNLPDHVIAYGSPARIIRPR